MVGGVLRCLGSSQRLRSKYGHGYQIEIGLVIPDGDAIVPQTQAILALLNKTADADGDAQLKRDDITEAFTRMSVPQWAQRVSETGSGADLHSVLNAQGYLTAKYFACKSIGSTFFCP